MEKQTDRHTDREKCTFKERERGRQKQRQGQRETDTETDKQTERQRLTDRQTDRQRSVGLKQEAKVDGFVSAWSCRQKQALEGLPCGARRLWGQGGDVSTGW